MSELGTFQAELVRALLAPTWQASTGAPGPLTRGITVHRNTVLKGLMDALADNYPTVERLVGRDWFVACAADYVRAFPPAVPTLALYGAGFADYLAAFAPAAPLPYLPDVARLDRLWTEAHFAEDAQALAGNTLARFPTAVLFEQQLAFHPATRFGWFKHSAVTVWLQNRPPRPAPAALEIDGADERALLTRPHGKVECIQINASACVFLARLREGDSLGDAATALLEADAAADVAGHLAQFIAAGAFANVEAISGGST